MVDERETRNGHGYLNCSMEPKTEARDSDNGELWLDGSSGGVSFGEGTSAENFRIYKRRKGRKMRYSDGKARSEFNDKIKPAGGSDVLPRFNFDASSFGQGECSLRHCEKTVLQPMHQSLNERGEGLRECIRDAYVTYSENGCMSAIKESVERSDNQTHDSAKEPSVVISSGLLNQPEGSRISELCERAFSDILISENFSELCGLLRKNFGVVSFNQIPNIDAIDTRIKTGIYETSPMLYHDDIQQLWTKLQQAGNEIVTLAKSLSDKSKAQYEQQFFKKQKPTEPSGASNCRGCGEKAYTQNFIVCDSCEEIYHVSCTDLIGTQIPPRTWYCTNCVSNGPASPHDNCIVCEKIKFTTKQPPVQNGAPNGSDHHHLETISGPKTCFVCKTDVNPGDDFRTCGHTLCAHKFYHLKCLTSRQLGVRGPCWYCPSCLCRRCLVDKDDDQIVLCDGCDQAYHIYCTSPQLFCIPKGSWFCQKCERELKRIKTVKMVYENMHMNVKVEEGLAAAAVVGGRDGGGMESGGLEMLVTAAKTLGQQETNAD